MKDLTNVPPPKRRQKARARFAWFLAGSVANYLLIATPFKWLQTHTQLPTLAISACSIGVGASFFFVWNYFINFRGDSRKRDALPRYLGAVLLMSALSSGLLTVLKQHNAHLAFSVGHFALDLDIVATQFFLAGLKFFLYHKWVFPLPKDAHPASLVPALSPTPEDSAPRSPTDAVARPPADSAARISDESAARPPADSRQP